MIEKIIIKNYRCFKNLTVDLQDDVNILIGANGAGKSTLLEAIGIALTGRLDGRWPRDEINPHWFNIETANDYFESYDPAIKQESPSISIELFLKSNSSEVERLRGKENDSRADVPGLKFSAYLDPELKDEFHRYIKESRLDEDMPKVIPTEYFLTHWSAFSAPDHLFRAPKGVKVAKIDTKIHKNTTGIDNFTRQLLLNGISSADSAELSSNMRLSQSKNAQKSLMKINDDLKDDTANSPTDLSVGIDTSTSSDWRSNITPYVEGVPFKLAGQGNQAIAKMEIAALRSSEGTPVILVEEPENYLTHTKLRQLISRLKEISKGSQLIVTTHSSFVLNRLGFDNLLLLQDDNFAKLQDLSSSHAKFFKKLPNFDTLRLVLADKVILVEGVSDLLIVERAILEHSSRTALDLGIDIISMEGTRHERWLSLAKLLNKTVYALRDSDGEDEEYWRSKYSQSLGDNGKLFVGNPAKGHTLEPQILSANPSIDLHEKLNLESNEETLNWMSSNKSESALKLVSLPPRSWKFPEYITRLVSEVCRG